MAAEIIEQPTEAPNTDELPKDEAAATTDELIQEFSGVDTTQAPPPAEDDLPDKYKGKSLKEVAAMHQEAEKALGRQGSEVGELRKVVDDYIRASMDSQAQQPEVPQEPAPDFFEDPERAVSHAIENHPEVRQARQAAQEMRRATSLNQLQQKHPDAPTVLNDPKFAEWVQGSPVRMELFQRADKNYDFAAADELMSNYKERASVSQQTLEAETTARQQQVRQASTGGTVQGANTAGAKRVYRRADIIKLMKEDPDRYEALSGEIMQAYAEGRVK